MRKNTDLKLPVKKEFEEWLKSKKPGSCVGIATRAASCPLAEFIIETYDRPCSVGVTPYHIRVNDHLMRTPPKQWIERFVIAVDDQYYAPKPVTREEALKALRSKPRKEHVEPR